MKDTPDPRDSFIYNLCKDRSLSHFNRVILFASMQDLYIPLNSALALTDDSNTQNCIIFNEMQQSITSACGKNIEQYQIVFPSLDPQNGTTWGWGDVLGREAHIAMLDDSAFIDIAIHLSRI